MSVRVQKLNNSNFTATAAASTTAAAVAAAATKGKLKRLQILKYSVHKAINEYNNLQVSECSAGQ